MTISVLSTVEWVFHSLFVCFLSFFVFIHTHLEYSLESVMALACLVQNDSVILSVAQDVLVRMCSFILGADREKKNSSLL